MATARPSRSSPPTCRRSRRPPSAACAAAAARRWPPCCRPPSLAASRAEIDAITDGLTGLYNHRYLHERLAEQIERAREESASLSLLFCNLDHFKQFNDERGHSSGDKALRTVAHVLEQAIRRVDLAARFGGEEFVLVLIDTALDGALEVAERIRSDVHEAGVALGDDAFTISIGVASFPDDGELKEELLDKAEWAMHLAKRRGRNQVVPFAGRRCRSVPARGRARPGAPGLTKPAAGAPAQWFRARHDGHHHRNTPGNASQGGQRWRWRNGEQTSPGPAPWPAARGCWSSPAARPATCP